MGKKGFKPKPPHGKGVKPIAEKVGVTLTVANYYLTPQAYTVQQWIHGFVREGLTPEEIATVLALPLEDVQKFFPREKKR